MRRLSRHFAFILAILALPSCDKSAEETLEMSGKVYVIVADDRSLSFIDDLSSVVRKYGFEANVGTAVDDKGKTLHVLDARGPHSRLRSENVLLSGQEDASKCGVHSEPYPDPRQFFISVSTSGKPNGDKDARSLLDKVSSDLRRSGYEVVAKPRLCGADEGKSPNPVHNSGGEFRGHNTN